MARVRELLLLLVCASTRATMSSRASEQANRRRAQWAERGAGRAAHTAVKPNAQRSSGVSPRCAQRRGERGEQARMRCTTNRSEQAGLSLARVGRSHCSPAGRVTVGWSPRRATLGTMLARSTRVEHASLATRPAAPERLRPQPQPLPASHHEHASTQRIRQAQLHSARIARCAIDSRRPFASWGSPKGQKKLLLRGSDEFSRSTKGSTRRPTGAPGQTTPR